MEKLSLGACPGDAQMGNPGQHPRRRDGRTGLPVTHFSGGKIMKRRNFLNTLTTAGLLSMLDPNYLNAKEKLLSGKSPFD